LSNTVLNSVHRHDFLGRNVGYGGLSIWTRHIKGIDFIEKWNGTAPSDDVSGTWKGAAFRYGSGEVWQALNAQCFKLGHIIVAGVEGVRLINVSNMNVD
jgi:hypothetical protein